MTLYNAGRLIRTLRKQKGLTQLALSEGIVEEFTLSRIETNKQTPSKATLDALMQRLGFSADTYPSNLMGEEEYKSINLKSDAVKAMAAKDFEKADSLIEQMESNPEFKAKLNEQFLMKYKSCIAYLRSQASILPMDVIYEALKITIPRFHEEEIHTYFLTNEEVRLINNLAVFYYEQGDIERAIRILKKLKKSIENSYEVKSERSSFYARILYNLSKYLGQCSHFSEAIKICDEGQDFCIENDILVDLPSLVYNKAHCLCMLDRKEESRELIKQAYYGNIMLKQYDTAELIREHAHTILGLDMIFDPE